ncbi:MAG: acetolactate synthase small subunit [Persephonella sp.]|nr:acetolactate synthase small subunit [Persephonella sp.]
MAEEIKAIKVRQVPAKQLKQKARNYSPGTALNAGVLTRITSLFAGRGYNIESLTVGKTHEPNVARITIVVEGNERVVEQIIKQLRKLIETLRVRDITDVPHIERELVLIKVHAGEDKARDEIMRLVGIFREQVCMMYPQKHTLVEITGNYEKIDAFINLVRPFGIKRCIKNRSFSCC